MITAPRGMYDMQAFNTGANAELVAYLPVGLGVDNPDLRTAIYSIDLGEGPPDGAVIRASAEVELTNDPEEVPGKYRAFTATQIILASTPDGVTGLRITAANGYNLTQEMHHGTHTKAGSLILPSGSSKRYVVLLGFAKTTSVHSVWTPDDRIRVEPDYGRLAVELFTPVG